MALFSDALRFGLWINGMLRGCCVASLHFGSSFFSVKATLGLL
jgi:hypothetical protein